MRILGDQVEKPKNYFFSDRFINAIGNIFRVPMTVVVAPAGYGKKMSVSGYLMSTNAEIFWLSAPKETDDAYFWKSLRNLFANSEMRTSNLPVITIDDMGSVISAIRQKVKPARGKEHVLVIDNFQNVSDTEGRIRGFLEYIVDNFIPGFHIVIISTAGIPFSGSFRASNLINEIGTKLLRLEKSGIADFFMSHGIELDEEDLELADSVSEGWLFALSAMVIVVLENGCFNANTVEEAQRRMSLFIRNYLYDGMPPEVKRFISLMYPAGDFSRAQARHVCGCAGLGVDSEECMDYLIRNNKLTDYDYYTERFHIHNLLNIVAGEEFGAIPESDRLKAEKALDIWKMRPGFGEEKIREDETAGREIEFLTSREKEIFILKRKGYTYKKIGSELFISENTVKTMIKNIYRKMKTGTDGEFSNG
jgi:ATP/maltotriose-dependent transcriptional regulator MalT